MVSSLGKLVLIGTTAFLLFGVSVALTHAVRDWTGCPPTLPVEVELRGVLEPPTPSPAGDFASLAMSPDGRRLATGTRGGLVSIWNAPDLHLLEQWRASAGTVSALAFATDGDHLLTAGDGRIEQWSLERSAPPRAMGHWSVTGFVSSLAVSPNGRTVALALGDRLVLHDLERGAGCEQRVPKALVIRALAFAPDGQSLASGGGGDHAIRIWGLADERLVLRDTLGLGAENSIRGLAYAADGCTLVSFDTEGRVRTWDRAGSLLEESFTGISLCRLAALQPDARLVLSVSDAEHLARLRRLPHTVGCDPSRSP